MVDIVESLRGIVQRVTYHNPENGWSVLRVQPFDRPDEVATVTVHQTRVFAGATMEFRGAWTVHPRYGRQFQTQEAVERKPASAAALEKYLGSGLIRGVGPKTARKIVAHFGAETLAVFEDRIDRLTEVDGIARKKLAAIKAAWQEHRAIREVMMFLQGHGISTLFAVRIYKEYGDNAIQMVSDDPYRLAGDIYGIGFFSADKVARSLGLAQDSPQRIRAAIRQVLAAAREQGHCYLSVDQIAAEAEQLLELELGGLLPGYLEQMEQDNQLRLRLLPGPGGEPLRCYYAKSLYYDEETVAGRLRRMAGRVAVDRQRMADWLSRFCAARKLSLSDEQLQAVRGAVENRFSVLTGGPGCGKTTTVLAIVSLLAAMGREVLLAAPTGRAAQRLAEVTGQEAKTLHRLLEWQRGSFQRNRDQPLAGDFLVVDECSMLDISLTAALLAAVPDHCQVLMVGDPDQLPSVGAGNVLRDVIAAGVAPCYRLTTVFRQARKSLIISHAHQVNRGEIPAIVSPFKKPQAWQDGSDCLFIDAEEASREQLQFIGRVKRFFDWQLPQREGFAGGEDPYRFRTQEPLASAYEPEFVVPARFRHVDLERLRQASGQVEELKAVLGKLHPWSALHYGLTALEVVVRLYQEWIPKYLGADTELQVLSPMTRGTLGTANLNRVIQAAVNPAGGGKRELSVGQRLFREGDRVIHRRNNYELGVFNGDIGRIIRIDNQELSCRVAFFPDGREVEYRATDIVELDLAYAITIHKSQGSEFAAVIMPVLTQHFKMLYRNLLYTGLTRARRLAVLVGSRRALAMAVRQQDTGRRQTALAHLLAAPAAQENGVG